nr:citrate lyase holo-[acyl-carrier protein] synthase [uncultured Bacillus sp.]
MIKFLFLNYSSETDCSTNLLRNYKKKYLPEDILSAKETRVYKQEQLIEKYKTTLLCMRVNYPGVRKNNEVTLGIMKALCHEIDNFFYPNILYRTFDITAEGPIYTCGIDQISIDVKRTALSIEENHFLGRCVDIDVYGKDGKGISRRDLGLKERKCFICQEPSQQCVRQGRHDLEDVKSYIKTKYENYLKICASIK